MQDLFGITSNTVMLAATGQHVGKTTMSLGVFNGLVDKFGAGRVAYCKPLGQRYREIPLPDGRIHKVDQDVEVMRNHFDLQGNWDDMSPVVFPPGFTRKVIDGDVQTHELLGRIKDAYTTLASKADFTLLEGSGHMGVGSIVNLNNAQVAGALGVDVVIIAPGGLGRSFDELALNKALLEKHGARLRGVILNKVEPDKLEMVRDYYTRQLDKLWNKPLLGCVPYVDAISRPTISGFAQLLQSDFIAGEENRLRTFEITRLILAHGGDQIKYHPAPNQLTVTAAENSECIHAVIENHRHFTAQSHNTQCLRGGLIVVGQEPPKSELIEGLKELVIPTVWVKKDAQSFSGEQPVDKVDPLAQPADLDAMQSAPPVHAGRTMNVLKMMNQYTQKHDKDDQQRLAHTVQHIQAHIDIEGLCAETPIARRVVRTGIGKIIDLLLAR